MSKAYYSRQLPDRLINTIEKNYPWLIPFVKSHAELDFQTGSNANSSWFQVYRGTGRMLKISASGKVSAHPEYRKRCEDFYNHPTPELFEVLLSRINDDPKFDRYYADAKLSIKREGYYQNLISRRYSFFTKPEDEFLIIDKELVIGFADTDAEEEWNKPIKDELEQCLSIARKELSDTSLPTAIKTKFGEFDFLGLTWNGDIVIMELKEADPQKTYMSPIQIGYYNRQFKKLLDEIPDLYEGIKKMVQQKIDMGILELPKGKQLPEKLSGTILNYLIVGNDTTLSPEVCRRFKLFKEFFMPGMRAYTCTLDGSLVPSKKL